MDHGLKNVTTRSTRDTKGDKYKREKERRSLATLKTWQARAVRTALELTEYAEKTDNPSAMLLRIQPSGAVFGV